MNSEFLAYINLSQSVGKNCYGCRYSGSLAPGDTITCYKFYFLLPNIANKRICDCIKAYYGKTIYPDRYMKIEMEY